MSDEGPPEVPTVEQRLAAAAILKCQEQGVCPALVTLEMVKAIGRSTMLEIVIAAYQSCPELWTHRN